jgi:hypothetical protein
VSGMPSGCVQFPCVIGKVAPTTYTSTSNGTTTSIATISTAGHYKLCVYFDTVVAGTGGSYSMLYWYGGDSHVFQNSFSGVSVNSQWQQNNSCVTFYADSGAISYQIRANSVTGAPTLRYAMTAEQLQ